MFLACEARQKHHKSVPRAVLNKYRVSVSVRDRASRSGTKSSFFFFLLGAVFLLGACAAPRSSTAPAASTPAPPPKTFRIVGYVTQAVITSTIPYDQITHINYAFLIPNDDGTFATLPNAWKLDDIVESAHQHEVQVLISVGGWGWDDEFETLAADPASRATFVRELTAFVDQHNLDGADIDWEYPDSGESAQNFLLLIRELRESMPEKLITAAVVSHGPTGAGIPVESFEIFDFINLMAYDGGTPHAPYTLAEDAFDYWLGRGLSPEKAVLGLPFYASPGDIPYRKLIAQDPQAAMLDEIEYRGATVNYNGIPTIQAKTRLAFERGSGVMIWTLEYDAEGEYSLLGAIHAAMVK